MYRENIFQIVMVYSRYHYQGAIHAKFVYCLLKQFLPVDHWCDRHMCWNTNIHKILPLCSFPLGLRSDPYWVHLQTVIVEGASASLRFISLDYLLRCVLSLLITTVQDVRICDVGGATHCWLDLRLWLLVLQQAHMPTRPTRALTWKSLLWF